LQEYGEGGFKQMVLTEIHTLLGANLVSSSVLEIKQLLREPGDCEFGAQIIQESFGGLRRFTEGILQAKFKRVASGEKRHKL
jgi:peroxisomal 3,2-trans-enoyl-CoA isomerase